LPIGSIAYTILENDNYQKKKMFHGVKLPTANSLAILAYIDTKNLTHFEVSLNLTMK